ncbi:hypothetical protein SDC9_152828 [bioreactor metagenome]|uniref:Uncharacterized protein n=1 Tax=bioreactor metagenome TaxID=1076179 RepID=A0A645EUP9_9ZZZZ
MNVVDDVIGMRLKGHLHAVFFELVKDGDPVAYKRFFLFDPAVGVRPIVEVAKITHTRKRHYGRHLQGVGQAGTFEHALGAELDLLFRRARADAGQVASVRAEHQRGISMVGNARDHQAGVVDLLLQLFGVVAFEHFVHLHLPVIGIGRDLNGFVTLFGYEFNYLL